MTLNDREWQLFCVSSSDSTRAIFAVADDVNFYVNGNIVFTTLPSF